MIIKLPFLKGKLTKKQLLQELRFLLCILLIILVMFLLLHRSIVNGSSMEPTLQHGDNHIVLRTEYIPVIPLKHSDIVIANWGDTPIIKRVIAIPGDTLEIRNGQVFLNGSYLKEPMEAQNYGPILLGEAQYFLMGDNRNVSMDSRDIGPVSYEDIYAVIYLEQQPLLWVCFIGCPFLIAGVMLYEPRKKKPEEETPPETAENTEA